MRLNYILEMSNAEIDLVERYAKITDLQRRITELQRQLRQRIIDDTDDLDIGEHQTMTGTAHVVSIVSYQASRLDKDAVAAFYKRHRAKIPTKTNIQMMVTVKPIASAPADFVDAETMMAEIERQIDDAGEA